jgi:hypothetical protein
MRADKPGRAAGGRSRKSGTKIIIVNGRAPALPVPRPVPVPPRPSPAFRPPAMARPAMARPAAIRPPMAPPPLPVPTALGPGLPPAAKRGGRIAGPHLTAGAKSAVGRLQKLRNYAEG